MSYSEPARTAACRTRSLASSPTRTVPTTGITIYGCGQEEAVLFREMAPRFGVLPTITEAAASEANIELAFANSPMVATADTSLHVSGRAIDIGHFDAIAWLSEHGAKYGLCQIYGNEPWHYELRTDATDHRCPAMYADPTHDPRMRQ